MSTDVGNAYIDVHGDLTPFRKDLSKLTAAAKKAARKNATTFADGWSERVRSELSGQWEGIMDAFYSGKKLDWDKVIGKFDSDNLEDASKQIKKVIENMSRADKLGKNHTVTYRKMADAVDNYVKAAMDQEKATEATRQAKIATDKLAKSYDGIQAASKLERIEQGFKGVNRAMADMDWSKFRKGFGSLDEMDNAVVEVMGHMEDLGRVTQANSKEVLASLDKYISAEEQRAKSLRSVRVETEQNRQKTILWKRSLSGVREAAGMQELERDFRELAAAMETLDFSKVVRGFKSWEDAEGHIRKVTNEMREMGRVSDSELKDVNDVLRQVSNNTKKFGVELDKTSRKFRPINFAIKKMQKSWDRMDSSVRMVMGLIAAAAGPMATLGSGIAGAATALASSLAMAAGSAVPLASAMSGVGVAIALAVKSMDSMKKAFPEIERAANRLGDVWTAQAERFGQEWGESVANLLNGLQQQLGRFDFGTPMGVAMAEITNGFREVVEGPEFTALLKHMRDTLPRAVADLGTGLAHLSNGLVSMLAAASPVARTLMNDFQGWAAAINHAITNARKSGELTRVFERMRESLLAVLDFAGSLGVALGTLFSIGARTGNEMLGSLTKIVDKFTQWMQTDAGRQAMLTWFQRAQTIIASLAPVAVGLGKALGHLVTDQSIAQFQNLMSVIGGLLPLLGNVLSTISQLGILNILAEAFRTVLAAVQPLMPALDRLFSAVGPTLQGAIRALAPLFASVASAVAPFIDGLAQIWEKVGPVLVPAFEKLTAALKPIIDTFKQIATVIIDFVAPILGGILVTLINSVVGLIQGLADVIMGIVGVIKGVFTGDLGLILESVKQIFSGALKAIWNFVKIYLIAGAGGLIKGFLGKVIGWFRVPFNAIKGVVSRAFTGMKNLITTILNGIGTFIRTVLTGIKNFFTVIWNGIRTGVMAALNGIRAFIMTIWNGIKVYLQLAMSVIRTIITTVWNFIRTKIQVVMNFIRTIITTVWNAIRTVFTTVLNALRAVVTTVWNAIRARIQAAMSAIRSVVTSIWNAIRSVVTSVVNAIRAVVSAVWNRIRATISSVMGRIRSVITSIWNRIKSVVSSVLNAIRAVVSSVWNRIRSTISSVMGKIRSVISSIWNKIKSVVSSVLNAIRSVVSSVWNRIMSTIRSILNRIQSTFSSIWNRIRSVVTNAINRVRSVISSGMNRVYSVVRSILSRVRSFFSSTWNNVRSTVSSALSRVYSTVRSKISQVVNFISGLPGKALRALSGFAGRMATAGRNMMQGFINGVRNMASNIANAALDAVGRAVDAVKNFLGIGSPSKLFRQFGEWTGEGMAIGIDRMKSEVQRAAASMAAATTKEFSHSKMFVAGKDAAAGLADGLNANRGRLVGALGNVNSSMRLNADKLNVAPITHRSAQETGQSKGKSFVLNEGAIKVESNAKNPETVAGQVVDDLASYSMMG